MSRRATWLQLPRFPTPNGNVPAFPQTDFHLWRNGNLHFTLYLKGHGDSHTRKIGEPPIPLRQRTSCPLHWDNGRPARCGYDRMESRHLGGALVGAAFHRRPQGGASRPGEPYAPATASQGSQTCHVGNPEIPSRKVKPWLSLKNPLHVGKSNPP